MSHSKQEVGVLTSQECYPLLGVVYFRTICAISSKQNVACSLVRKAHHQLLARCSCWELANYHWGCFGFLHILVGLLLHLLLLLLLSQLSLLGEVLRWALQDTFLLGNYILCALLLFLAVPFKQNQN